MARVRVCNASPLIFLSRIDHLELLPRLYGDVMVPETVVRELEQGESIDSAFRSVEKTAGLIRVPDRPVPAEVYSWRLDPGETQVLTLAFALDYAEVIIDDRAARRCSSALSLPCVGTIGVIALAKQRGLIASAEPYLNALTESGMRIRKELIEALLKRLGE